MKKRFSKINNFIKIFGNEDVSVDTKSMYLVIIYSILVNAGYCLFFALSAVEPALLYMSTGITLYFVMILYLVGRFDDIELFKYILVISMNFVIYPLLFYMTGNLLNGTILFFPLGVVFTFFLIKEKIVFLIFALEMIWYCIIIALPMLDYDRFAIYNTSISHKLGISVSFVAVACAPIFIIVYQTMIYEKTKRMLEESRHMIEYARFNKSRFLANVTHEIRTPMNAIIGMNELILREDLDSESRELAENIKSSSNQLLKIINNILEFSKLDSNKMDLYPVKYDFKDLMQEIINAVSNEYASENIGFIAKIDPNIPRTLFGDMLRIKQIFMYLLFSTVHKLPHSLMSMQVRGEVDINTNTVMLSCTISESGYGISEAEIEAMLSAYTRYDSRQKSDYKGMGLELSICKEILELMGGKLSIKSVENVGMSVYFEFLNYIIEDSPIVRVSSMNDYNILVYTKNIEDQDIWIDILQDFSLYPNFVSGPNAFRQAIENRRYTHVFIDDMFYPMLKDTIKSAQIKDEVYILTEPGSIYSDFDNCKILRKPITCICVANALNNTWDADSYKIAQKREAVIYPEAKVIIVDDSIVNLKVLEGMLQTFELQITKCKSGAEALSILEKDEFDLIILDQRMPEMDGIELLGLIRKLDNANAMVPVLCATADFGPEVSRMLLNVGFQDYLAKPVRKFYLERMLRKYIPSELAVNIEIDDATPPESEKTEEEEKTAAKDPREIDFNAGLNNVGNIMSAFASVINAYYREGMEKLQTVPKLLEENDIGNYITEVHALKSSSAAIGAQAMSVLFRELEFAGKANNIEFIEGHTGSVMAAFKDVLDVIKAYLEKEGLFEKTSDDIEPEGEEVKFDDAILDEIIDSLTNFNINETEAKVKECVSVNYGKEINTVFRSVKSLLDIFDYHKAKDELTELKRRRNESGI